MLIPPTNTTTARLMGCTPVPTCHMVSPSNSVTDKLMEKLVFGVISIHLQRSDDYLTGESDKIQMY